MTYPAQLITGIAGFTDALAYEGAVGQLPGAATMTAAVLVYNAQEPGSADTIGLWGNIDDDPDFGGWGVGINPDGSVFGQYGDGSAFVVATSDTTIEPYRWTLLVLTLISPGDMVVYANGQLCAHATATNALVGSANSPVLGAVAGQAGPNNDTIIAGAGYLAGTALTPPQVLEFWRTVSRTGLLEQGSPFTNLYQSQFYNDGGHPPTSNPEPADATWEDIGPGTAVNLTASGAGLIVGNAPAIWSSQSLLSGSVGPTGPASPIGPTGPTGPTGGA